MSTQYPSSSSGTAAKLLLLSLPHAKKGDLKSADTVIKIFYVKKGLVPICNTLTYRKGKKIVLDYVTEL